ncbi:MAG: 2-C-methyl-D-erythritol 2,4-cyclodiphosphate synthase [Evtepia gabavorous]
MPCWGAAALGDIGQHFPDTDPAYRDISSLTRWDRVMALLAAQGWRWKMWTSLILAQRPKLKDYLPQMRQNYSRAMGLPVTAISVKATTEEGLGFTGTEQGIAAHGVVLLESLGK